VAKSFIDSVILLGDIDSLILFQHFVDIQELLDLLLSELILLFQKQNFFKQINPDVFRLIKIFFKLNDFFIQSLDIILRLLSLFLLLFLLSLQL